MVHEKLLALDTKTFNSCRVISKIIVSYKHLVELLIVLRNHGVIDEVKLLETSTKDSFDNLINISQVLIDKYDTDELLRIMEVLYNEKSKNE